MKQTYNLELFADYFQIYLQDPGSCASLEDAWTPDATDLSLALAPGIIGIRTARNTTVPLTIEITEKSPDEFFVDWDQVIECSMHVNSGQMIAAGCSDYLAAALRIQTPAPCYRARIYYAGLSTVSQDGLSGKDFYKAVLWPASYQEVKIIKSRQQD